VRFLQISAAALAVAGATAAPALATFPGQNGEIAFVRAGDIWAINADGAGLHRITTDPGNEYSPAWSPDGTRLAFIREGNGNADVWTSNPDGTDAVQVTTTDADENSPAWSPDGTRLLFSRVRPAIMGYDLYVANADGTGETFLRAQAFEADWSPAGDRIAVRAGLDDASRIAFEGPGGQDLGDLPTVRSTDFGGGIDLWPTWSPDGSRLAYSRGRYDDEGHFHHDLAVNAGTTAEKVLVTGGEEALLPTWSPDGTQIAFSAMSQIWVMSTGGGQPRQVTIDALGASGPAWRPLQGPAPPAPPAPPSPPPVGPAGVAPLRLRVLRMTAPSRARVGSRVTVTLRFDGTLATPVTLQRKGRRYFRSFVTTLPKGATVRLRFRARTPGLVRLKVVFRTSGVLVGKPLSVLVRP
jgi:Tol biopolymer transport system component